MQFLFCDALNRFLLSISYILYENLNEENLPFNWYLNDSKFKFSSNATHLFSFVIIQAIPGCLLTSLLCF